MATLMAGLEQRHKLACLIKRIKIVAAADMLSVDENLRNGGSATGSLAHFVAPLAVGHDIDFREIGTAFFKQLLGAVAVTAKHGRIDLNLGHLHTDTE